MAGCSDAFNSVLHEVVWHHEHDADPREQELLASLRATLQRLLDAYPPPPKAATSPIPGPTKPAG
jgi:hypothetical protein